MVENIDFNAIYKFGAIALALAIFIPLIISKLSAHKTSTLKSIIDEQIKYLESLHFDEVEGLCRNQNHSQIEHNGTKYIRLLTSNVDDIERPASWELRINVRIETMDKSEADYELMSKKPPVKGLYADGLKR